MNNQNKVIFNVHKKDYNIDLVYYTSDSLFQEVETFQIKITNRKKPMAVLIQDPRTLLLESSFICQFKNDDDMKLFLEDLYYMLETENDIPTFLRQTEDKKDISVDEILNTFEDRRKKHAENLKVFLEKVEKSRKGV